MCLLECTEEEVKGALLENLTDDHLPLFDETLRHIELFNIVPCQIQRNPPKPF